MNKSLNRTLFRHEALYDGKPYPFYYTMLMTFIDIKEEAPKIMDTAPCVFFSPKSIDMLDFDKQDPPSARFEQLYIRLNQN